jgi:hypothetical protein
MRRINWRPWCQADSLPGAMGKTPWEHQKKRPKKNIPDGWMLVGKIIELRGFSIFQP